MVILHFAPYLCPTPKRILKAPADASGRHDNQYNGNQNRDTQYNDMQCKDAYWSNIPNNGNQFNDNEYNDSQYNNT